MAQPVGLAVRLDVDALSAGQRVSPNYLISNRSLFHLRISAQRGAASCTVTKTSAIPVGCAAVLPYFNRVVP
jgi:hypothetical protein